MCEGPKTTTKPLPFEDSDRTMTDNDSDFGSFSELEKEIRIVLIGKTGCGKSATGNTIVGKDAFKSVSSFSAVTKKCSSGSNNRFGKKLLVVDTPGLFDTDMTNAIIMKEIVKCIGMTSPGPHAIVFVITVGRFTKEEQDTVNLFADVFGEGMFNHMIVLFTRRDDLERQNDTIQSCVQKAGSELKQLLKKCNQRYIAFDNNQASAMREEDAMALVQMVRDITVRNDGKCYSNEMYKEAEKLYCRRVEEIERQKNREKKRAPLKKEKEKYENQIHQAEERGRQLETEHRRREQELLKDVETKHQRDIWKMRSDIRQEYEEEHQGIIPSLFAVLKSVGKGLWNLLFKYR